MLTAGIMIDDWKLPIFKKMLDEEGYKYEKHPGLTEDTLLLKVETDAADKLAKLVVKMNKAAAKSKMN